MPRSDGRTPRRPRHRLARLRRRARRRPLFRGERDHAGERARTRARLGAPLGGLLRARRGHRRELRHREYRNLVPGDADPRRRLAVLHDPVQPRLLTRPDHWCRALAVRPPGPDRPQRLHAARARGFQLEGLARAGSVSAPHLPRHDRWTADRHRRRDGTALCSLRREWRGRSRRGTHASPSDPRLRRDEPAGGPRRRADPGRLGHRRQPPGRALGRGARLRRPKWRLPLGVECRPAGRRRSRCGRRLPARHRERVVDHLRGPRAQPRVGAHGQPVSGLLRRGPPRPRPLRELGRRPRRHDRRAALELPDGPPRRLGLRRARAAELRRPAEGRTHDPGRRPGDQDGPHLRAGSRDR